MFCNDQRNQTKKKVAVAKVAPAEKKKQLSNRLNFLACKTLADLNQ